MGSSNRRFAGSTRNRRFQQLFYACLAAAKKQNSAFSKPIRLFAKFSVARYDPQLGRADREPKHGALHGQIIWAEQFHRFQGEQIMAKHETNHHKVAQTLATPTDLDAAGVEEISSELRKLLADVFALYLKTKNFHWHMSGQHFRDYHLLLDEHADQIFSMTDDVAERARKIGGTTLHSISDISHHQRLKDNSEEFVAPRAMLKELSDDNQHLTRSMRATHEVCDRHNDVATASMIEVWIDQAERRTWFLSEIVREH
jgi:starvation-inducible DNA-binding protein